MEWRDKPGCPALRRRLRTLKIAPGQLFPTPYHGHLSAGDPPSCHSWKTRSPFHREGLPDTGQGENTEMCCSRALL